jgi:putative Ig domain-containing protein
MVAPGLRRSRRRLFPVALVLCVGTGALHGQGNLTITTSSLPDGRVGSSYSARITATGGTSPYKWSVISGTAPTGLGLSSDGVLSGTPQSAGTFTFTVQVADDRDKGKNPRMASRSLHVTITGAPPPPEPTPPPPQPTPPASFPTLSLTGLPDSVNPTQSFELSIALSSPLSVVISGTITVAFTSNASIPTDDPSVRFSTGTRTMNFVIPANSTTGTFESRAVLLAGTVTGVVRVMASISNGPSDVLLRTAVIRAAPPQVTNVMMSPTPGGFQVQVTGYSPDRRVLSAQFTFDVRTPDGIQQVTLTRNVDDDFGNWYRSQNSTAFGSSFVYTQSFSIQGDMNAIQAVSVSLINGQGATSSAGVPMVVN